MRACRISVLGVEGEPLRLPAESRDAERLASRLRPVRVEGLGFAWLVARPGSCEACVVYGSRYSVEYTRVRVRDPLSGLTLSLPAPRGLVDGRVVWEARWRRGLLRVEGFNCDAIVDYSGGVRCAAGGFRCSGLACLEECRSTLGP